MIKDDKILTEADFGPILDIKSKVEEYRSLYQNPGFIENENEYQRIKKENKCPSKHWYAMFGGPANLRELSRHLHRLAQYEMLYRQWSDSVHGTGIGAGEFGIGPSGTVSIVQLRLPENAQIITHMAVSFGLMIFRLYLTFFANGKVPELNAWYAREIRARYQAYSSHDIIEII